MAQFLNRLSVFFIIFRLCLLDIVKLLLQDLIVCFKFASLHQIFLRLAFKTLLLSACIIFGFTNLLLMLLFELKFDVLLSSELTLNMTTLNIQYFCHELSLAFGQVEPLFSKFKAFLLVIIAQQTASEENPRSCNEWFHLGQSHSTLR